MLTTDFYIGFDNGYYETTNTNNLNPLDYTISSILNIQSVNALDFVIKCYKFLKVNGFIRNKVDFSIKYLGKSKHMYSLLLCLNKIPSCNVIQNILTQLEFDIQSILNKTTKQQLTLLHNEGTKFLLKQMMKEI